MRVGGESVGRSARSKREKFFAPSYDSPFPIPHFPISPLFYRVEMRFWGEKGGRKKVYKIMLEGLTYTTLCAIIRVSI